MSEERAAYQAKPRRTRKQNELTMALQAPSQPPLPLASESAHVSFEERATAIFRAMRNRYLSEFRGNREYVGKLDDEAFQRIVLAHVRRWICPYQPK